MGGLLKAAPVGEKARRQNVEAWVRAPDDSDTVAGQLRSIATIMLPAIFGMAATLILVAVRVLAGHKTEVRDLTLGNEGRKA